MRTVLIGAVDSTRVVLEAMQAVNLPPSLLCTFSPELGPKRHDDYVPLAPLAGLETEVLFVDKINDPATLDRLRVEDADAIFVIGWSQIVGPELRSMARRWCIGFHPAPLPAMRGRAVLSWTILLGHKDSGATIFAIDDGIDSGAILAQRRYGVAPRETVSTLGAKCVTALDEMIRDLLPNLANGTARAMAQPNDNISYCARRTSADHLIDWNDDSHAIDRLIRASGRPYSGAFTFTRNCRVTIWSAEPFDLPYAYHASAGQIVEYRDNLPVVRCGDGKFLLLTELELADGTRLSGQARLRRRPGQEWE